MSCRTQVHTCDHHRSFRDTTPRLISGKSCSSNSTEEYKADMLQSQEAIRSPFSGETLIQAQLVPLSVLISMKNPSSRRST